MLVLTRKIEESITIGSDITVSVLEIKGNQVKIGIKAPKDVPVYRAEIYESVMNENVRAAQAPVDLEQLQNSIKLEIS